MIAWDDEDMRRGLRVKIVECDANVVFEYPI
jgi:hypothetical protein